MLQLITPNQPKTQEARRAPLILPGDRVLVYDALTAMNIWHVVADVLIACRIKIQVQGIPGYFASALVLRHQKARR